MSYADSPTSPLPSPLHSPVMNHFPHAIQVWHLFSFSFFLLSLSYFLTCSFPISFLSFPFLSFLFFSFLSFSFPFPFISFLLAVLWSASILFLLQQIYPPLHTPVPPNAAYSLRPAHIMTNDAGICSTLFVANLGKSCTENELHNLFSRYNVERSQSEAALY